MAGKDKGRPAGYETMVTLNPDIYRLALERGIDISDACNRALAGLTGTDYPSEHHNKNPALPPIIIAKDGATAVTDSSRKRGSSRKMHPVINADDPAAPAKIAETNVPVKNVPAGEGPVTPAPSPHHEGTAATPARKAEPSGARPAPKKKHTGADALKTFFLAKLVRTGDAGDTIGKDEFYDLFTRFCHDHKIARIPERRAVTVALKNQFALAEKVVDGTPSWTGIRVK